jgi:thioredoxin-related protein
MKVHFSVKSVLLVIFFFSFVLISCNNEEDTTNVAENKSSANFKERLITSEKIRTEDMIVFRTKLQEAVQIGQKGNKQQYEKMLLEAATEYLDFNKVAYDKTESKSAIFSKALAFYSDKISELN